jgi:hypothetical protein
LHVEAHQVLGEGDDVLDGTRGVGRGRDGHAPHVAAQFRQVVEVDGLGSIL